MEKLNEKINIEKEMENNMLNVHEIDELFQLEDARKKISSRVKALYDYPVKFGKDIENMKRVHAFIKELRVLLASETKAVENMEQFLEAMIEKYS